MFDKIFGRGHLFETRDAVIYLFRGYTIMGVNPTQKYKHLYYVYAFCSYFVACVIAPLAFNLCYIFEGKTMQPSQLLTSLQAGMNVWGIPAKIIIMTLSLKQLRRAEPYMAQLDARCQRSDELAKLRQLTMTGNRVVLIFCCIYSTYGLCTFLGNIGSGQATYSLYLYFIDWRSSKSAFYTQQLIEFVVIFILLYHQVLNDCYPVIYIYMLRTHMQILVERVRRLGTNPALNQQQNYAELVLCIVDHQCLLHLYERISAIISVTVFVQFLITAIILGTTLINILIFADTAAQIAALFYFVAVLTQISPTCYQATCLMQDNEQLSVAIFQSNWIEQDQRFRKMLIFFMQRAQKTMTLTAMKLFPITLDTGVSIAKFSFSLYTLVKEMDFGQNFKN